jgi:small-conductance mechanosensitive channel
MSLAARIVAAYSALNLGDSSHLGARAEPNGGGRTLPSSRSVSMSGIQDLFNQLIEYQLLGNTLLRWGIAAGVALLVFLAALLFRRYGVTRLRNLAQRTSSAIDDFIVGLVVQTHALLLLIASLYAGSLMLSLPDQAMRILGGVLVVAVAVQAILWTHKIVDFAIETFVRRRQGQQGDAAEPVLAAGLGVFKFIILLAVYAVIVLFALSNMGVNITAWITGMGIGGIAIALAVQSVLGDLFASMSIVLDKPFVVGDFIIVGDKMGTVERIGIKTTRVRSLSGEQLVFANSDLLSSRVQNFKRMNERRVVFTINVVYGTGLEKLKLIPPIITAAVKAQGRARFDRSHFKAFGAFSLDFETVYYVLDRDYNVYMDIQQAINLEIVRRFEDEGIEFAFPTQTLHLVREPAPTSAPARPAVDS